MFKECSSIQLSKIPHFTIFQKFPNRITGTVLERRIANLILLIDIKQIFLGTDATGLKPTNESQYYTYRARLRRRKWIKLSTGADMLKQVICTIKVRRAPARYDNVDFELIVMKTAEIKPLSIVIADKGYDSGEGHILVRERHHVHSITYHHGIKMYLRGVHSWQVPRTAITRLS